MTHTGMGKTMKRVVVESPFAGEILRNEIYAEFACHDCLVNHGESPYASHILYTRKYDPVRPGATRRLPGGVRAGGAAQPGAAIEGAQVGSGW